MIPPRRSHGYSFPSPFFLYESFDPFYCSAGAERGAVLDGWPSFFVSGASIRIAAARRASGFKGNEWKSGGSPRTLSFPGFYVILFLMNGPAPIDPPGEG